MWVTNGRAAAPEGITCSIGVSISTYSRSWNEVRSECMTSARWRTVSRASWRTMRSTYRWRTRDSSERSAWSTGSGRTALAAICQVSAKMLSSPRRDAPTRPWKKTWSPRSTSALRSARRCSPITAWEAMICRRCPAPSWRVMKASLPALRWKTTRPATPTSSFVSSPAPRCPYFARTPAMVAATGTETGQASSPRASSRSRLDLRTATWSEVSVVSRAGEFSLMGAIVSSLPLRGPVGSGGCRHCHSRIEQTGALDDPGEGQQHLSAVLRADRAQGRRVQGVRVVPVDLGARDRGGQGVADPGGRGGGGARGLERARQGQRLLAARGAEVGVAARAGQPRGFALDLDGLDPHRQVEIGHEALDDRQ